MERKLQVGDRVKYRAESTVTRPPKSAGEEFTILAVDNYGRGYIFPRVNPWTSRGTIYKDWMWEISAISVEFLEPLEPIKQEFVIEYDEPTQEEFTENCLETCKPGDHACGKK